MRNQKEGGRGEGAGERERENREKRQVLMAPGSWGEGVKGSEKKR